MTVIQKTIGRLPVNLGDYDSTRAYGKKNRVLLYGCEWESKVNNNTYAPATLNTTTGVITPDTTHWKLINGSYNTWLIDNGYQKMAASNVKDSDLNDTQDNINASIIGEIGSDSSANTIKGRIKVLETSVGSGGSVDERIAAEGAQHYLKSETYTKSEVNGMITTPDQEYVTVTATDQTTSVTDVLPATGEPDTVYRVGNWDGNQYDATAYSEYAWNESTSQYIHLSTKPQIGEVFDISAYHATGGTLATYDDLAAALGTNGANIPESIRKGGMSVKFVQNSDNKYVQCRLKTNSFSINPSDWENISEMIGIVPDGSSIMNEISSELTVSEDGNLYNQKILDNGTITSQVSANVHYLAVNKGDIITINVSTSVTGLPLNVFLYNVIPSSSVTSANVLASYLAQPFATDNTYNIIADGYFAFSCRRENLSMTIKKQVRRTTVLQQELAAFEASTNSNLAILNKSWGYFLNSSTMDIALCKNLNEVITRLEVNSGITEKLCIRRFQIDTTNKLLTVYIDGVTSGNRYLSIYQASYDGREVFDYVSNSGVKITINTSVIDTSLSFYTSSSLQSTSFAVINIEKCRYISTYPFKGNGLFDEYVTDIKISGKDWNILNPAGNIILKDLYYIKRYNATSDTFLFGLSYNGGDAVTLNMVDATTYKGTMTVESSIYGTYTSEYVLTIRKKPAFTIDDTNRYSKLNDDIYVIYYNNYLNSIAQRRAGDAVDWSWKLQNYQWFWSSANCLPFMVKRANSKGQSTQTTTGNDVQTFPSLCIFLNNDTHYALYPSSNPQVDGFEGSLVREHSWLNADLSAYEIIHSYLALGDIMNIGDWTKVQWKAQWQKYWEFIDEYAKRPQLVCLGNHDINQDYANVFEVPFDSVDDPDFSWDDIQWASKGEQRAYIIQPMLDRYKTLLGIVEDTNNAQSCYYYFDAKYQDSREGGGSTDKYLRMLVLDVYDFPDTWNPETRIKNYGYWDAHGTAPHKGDESFSLAQIRFIVNALESVITQGRDVCICGHDFSLSNADTIFSDYANKRQNSFTYTDLYGNSGVVSYDFTGGNGKMFFLHGHTHRWFIGTKCDRYAFRLVSAEGMGSPRKYVRDTADILVYDESGLRFTRYGNCPRQLEGDKSGDLLGFHFVDEPIDTATIPE